MIPFNELNIRIQVQRKYYWLGEHKSIGTFFTFITHEKLKKESNHNSNETYFSTHVASDQIFTDGIYMGVMAGFFFFLSCSCKLGSAKIQIYIYILGIYRSPITIIIEHFIPFNVFILTLSLEGRMGYPSAEMGIKA